MTTEFSCDFLGQDTRLNLVALCQPGRDTSCRAFSFWVLCQGRQESFLLLPGSKNDSRFLPSVRPQAFFARNSSMDSEHMVWFIRMRVMASLLLMPIQDIERERLRLIHG